MPYLYSKSVEGCGALGLARMGVAGKENFSVSDNDICTLRRLNTHIEAHPLIELWP